MLSVSLNKTFPSFLHKPCPLSAILVEMFFSQTRGKLSNMVILNVAIHRVSMFAVINCHDNFRRCNRTSYKTNLKPIALNTFFSFSLFIFCR